MQDASIELLERGIMKPPAPTTAGETSPLIESAELVDILMVAYKSLCESGLPTVADGVKKDARLFWAIVIYQKRSLCQDRLGTNTRCTITQTRIRFTRRHAARSHPPAQVLRALAAAA